MGWWTSGRSGEQQPIQGTSDAPVSSAALPTLTQQWQFGNEIRIVNTLCVSEIVLVKFTGDEGAKLRPYRWAQSYTMHLIVVGTGINLLSVFMDRVLGSCL